MAQPATDLVGPLLNQIKDGENAHKKRVKVYDDSYKAYRPATGRSNRASSSAWESDLRVPYAMQTIDTAMVNIVGGKPRIKVLPRRPGDEASAKKMQLVQDYYIDADHFVEKEPAFVQQGLIYGVTVAKEHWLYQENQAGRVLYDGPCFEPWDIYDAWWDPNGRDPQSAAYVVLRSWMSKDDLLRAPNFEQDAVQELLRMGASKSNRSTSAQESANKANDSKRKDLFEILEIWTNDDVIVVGGRKTLLRHEPNPFDHGQKPVVIAQPRPDLFEIAGIPSPELIIDIQQALWTLMNMRYDNLHLSVARGITYREGGVTDPSALEIRPRFKWPVMDHDDIKPFEVQPLPPEAYKEDEILLGRAQLVTGINPYVSGSDLSTVDQNTATGVTALQEVASKLLRFQASQLQYKGYQRTFEMRIANTKQFLTEEMAVRIEGQGGAISWEHVSPDEIRMAEYDIKVQGTEESLSKQQERGEAIALLNAFAPLAPLGIINWTTLVERVGEAYDFPNPEALVNPPQQAPQAAPFPQQGAQPQQPQTLQGGQQLSPQIQQAIQAGR